MLILNRAYLPDQSCTIGNLTLPCGWSCYTIERPWLNNQSNVSCIPEGLYSLGLRHSGVVARTSGGEFTEGWEVQDVSGRTYIMIHPGNWASDSQGCILPGAAIGSSGAGRLMVSNSRHVFKELMTRLSERDHWKLQIKTMEGGRCE